jgi:hypothetical protein
MSRNFFVLLLFLSLPFSPMTQTNTCNFSLYLGEGINPDLIYPIHVIGMNNLNPLQEKKIRQILDLENLATCKMTLAFFEEKLSAVCRYKKFELSRVEVAKVEKYIHLILDYSRISRTTKSKL